MPSAIPEARKTLADGRDRQRHNYVVALIAGDALLDGGIRG